MQRAPGRGRVAGGPAGREPRDVVVAAGPHRRAAVGHERLGRLDERRAARRASNGACRNGMLKARPSSSPVAVERDELLDVVARTSRRRAAAAGRTRRRSAPASVHVVHLGPVRVVHRALAPQLRRGPGRRRSPAGCRGGRGPSRSCARRRCGTRRRPGRTRTAGSGRTRRAPRRSTSSGRPARAGSCAGSIWPGRLVERPGRARRSCSPSCSAAHRRAPGRPRRTSRGARASRDERDVDEPRVLDARVVRHEVEQDPDSPSSARPRSARRGRRWFPRSGARRSSRRRRSPSRRSATGTSGTSQIASMPSHSRWSRCAVIPARSPIPSPFGVGERPRVDLVADRALPPLAHARHATCESGGSS